VRVGHIHYVIFHALSVTGMHRLSFVSILFLISFVIFIIPQKRSCRRIGR
jgi:hypothetical protein